MELEAKGRKMDVLDVMGVFFNCIGLDWIGQDSGSGYFKGCHRIM